MARRPVLLRSCASLTALSLSLLCTTTPVSAAPHLSFGTLHKEGADEVTETYGYVARDVVSSLNSLASGAALWGHDALDLDNRGPLARGAYLLTAGQLVARLHWANSLYFGHELMHFSAAHAHGRDVHYFRDRETGAVLSDWAAWSRIATQGDVGGPAVSGSSHGSHSSEDPDHDRAEAVVAGLNWQMSYSEDRVRDRIFRQDITVFDAPDLLFNRIYTLAYTVGDIRRGQEDEIQGDPRKWADHVEATTGEENVLERAALIGLAATIFSPVYMTTAGSIGEYLQTSRTEVPAHGFSTAYGSVTWDLPHYINPESLTVAPMLYWSPGQQQASLVGADRLVLGGGIEFPALGEDDLEAHLTLDGKWGEITLGAGLAMGPDGAFLHSDASLDLTDHVALTAAGAFQVGETLRGARDFPDGTAEVWAGLRFSF